MKFSPLVRHHHRLRRRFQDSWNQRLEAEIHKIEQFKNKVEQQVGRDPRFQLYQLGSHDRCPPKLLKVCQTYWDADVRLQWCQVWKQIEQMVSQGVDRHYIWLCGGHLSNPRHAITWAHVKHFFKLLEQTPKLESYWKGHGQWMTFEYQKQDDWKVRWPIDWTYAIQSQFYVGHCRSCGQEFRYRVSRDACKQIVNYGQGFSLDSTFQDIQPYFEINCEP